MFFPTFLVFTYLSGLYLRLGFDTVLRVGILEISEFAVLAALPLLLYAAEGAAPVYLVGYIRFDHVEGKMLVRLPFHLINILRRFGFSKIAERCRWILYLWISHFIEKRRLIGLFHEVYMVELPTFSRSGEWLYS